MTKPKEKPREELQAEIEEEAAALLRLALTSEPAREFLKKRAESGNAE